MLTYKNGNVHVFLRETGCVWGPQWFYMRDGEIKGITNLDELKEISDNSSKKTIFHSFMHTYLTGENSGHIRYMSFFFDFESTPYWNLRQPKNKEFRENEKTQ